MTSPTFSQYSLNLKVQLSNEPGVLGTLASAVGSAGGNIFAIDGFVAKGPTLERDIVVNCADAKHMAHVVDVVEAVDGVELLDHHDRTFKMHEGGKIEVLPLCPVGDADDLSMAYSPGVARICNAIKEDETAADRYTIRKNTVAIVTDGTAVLGLGDIGPKAALPVMEGKALLFKEFADVDAFPLCLNVRSAEELIETVERFAPTFGGINLEDIAAPAAFEVETELKRRLDIPVFHDDQHGTAVVTLAGLQNALKVAGRSLADATIVMIGVGAAGVAVGKMLSQAGAENIVGFDRRGALHSGQTYHSAGKQWFADNTNPENRSGSLRDVLKGADVFVGLSGPDLLTEEDLRQMAPDPIIFAMANPDPEIRPELAKTVASVVATGRSDYPNQINNVLAFPGIFRGALDVQASDITSAMQLAAAEAIAASVSDQELSPEFVIPSVFDTSVPKRVAQAVAEAAVADGVARLDR